MWGKHFQCSGSLKVFCKRSLHKECLRKKIKGGAKREREEREKRERERERGIGGVEREITEGKILIETAHDSHS